MSITLPSDQLCTNKSVTWIVCTSQAVMMKLLTVDWMHSMVYKTIKFEWCTRSEIAFNAKHWNSGYFFTRKPTQPFAEKWKSKPVIFKVSWRDFAIFSDNVIGMRKHTQTTEPKTSENMRCKRHLYFWWKRAQTIDDVPLDESATVVVCVCVFCVLFV